MLGEFAVLYADDVHRNPVGRMAEVAEAAVDHDPFVLGENQPMFIAKRGWGCPDEIEETFPAGLNVSAVLDVLRRPELLGCRVIALIEQCIERLQDQFFVSFFEALRHLVSPVAVVLSIYVVKDYSFEIVC